MSEVVQPFEVFTDLKGDPLEDGFIYIGAAGLNPEVTPVAVYWDIELTSPAAQPIRTIGGYPSRNGSVGRIFVSGGGYSITVRDKQSRLIYTAVNAGTPEQEFVNPKDFGAVGDGVTDDTTAIKNAISFAANLKSKRVVLSQRYLVSSTIHLTTPGIQIQASYPAVVDTATVSTSVGGLLYADFTSGPVISIESGGIEIAGLTIQGSSSRRASSITTGHRLSNSGIIVENPDGGSPTIQNVTLRDLKITTHPADGILIEGDVTNLSIDNCYEMNCGRHGIAITSGQLGGRTSVQKPGIINIIRGKAFDIGGHGLLIGHPSASADVPFRVNVKNWEQFRCALDSSQRYTTDASWVVGFDIKLESCAFSGTTTGNIPDHSTLLVGGRDILIQGCRYISGAGANYVFVVQHPGLSTMNVEFNGGTCSSSAPPDDFLTVDNGPDGITVNRVRHDGANRITDLADNINNNNITVQDIDSNKTVYQNHEYDYAKATVSGLISRGVKKEIIGGVITIDKQGLYLVDTESMAASDDLVTINGGETGDVIYLRQDNSGRVVTIVRGTGNIRLSGGVNFTFTSSVGQFMPLIFDGTNWRQLSTVVTSS